jgi:hypothetical protein
MLKACATLVNHPLSYIYNHLLYKGIFRDHLKIAIVKPLYKTGDKNNMANYWSLSLLTGFLRSWRNLCAVE